MIRACKAKFTNSSTPFYRQNPLIEALPPYDSTDTRTLLDKLKKIPPRLDNLPTASQKADWLLNCSQDLFIPLPRHLFIMQSIDSLIRMGYVRRSPLRHVLEQKHIEKSGDKYPEWDTSQTGASTALSITIIGYSGVGKTYAVKRILHMYPQLIHHQSNNLIKHEIMQIVWLHVECPHKGSPKSLCIALLSAVDEITGSEYTKGITQRMTLDRCRMILVEALKNYYVGIIAIDEIQNLMASAGDGEGLFNFITELSNTINVPIIFIGTPKIKKFLTKDFRIARRFCSLGFHNWTPLTKKESKVRNSDWNIFCDGLKALTVIDGGAEDGSLSEELKQQLFRYSYGITDVVVKLYEMAQIACIRHSRDSSYITKAVKQVFDEYFGSIAPVILALRQNDIKALERYDDMLFSEQEFSNAIKALSKLQAADEEFQSEDLIQNNNELDERLLKDAEAIASSMMEQAKDCKGKSIFPDDTAKQIKEEIKRYLLNSLK